MQRILGTANAPRVLKPTTLRKFAERILATSRISADTSSALRDPVARDLLLTVFIAEEDGRCIAVSQLRLPGQPSNAVTSRYVTLLEQDGLVERRREFIAMTNDGYEAAETLLKKIYEAQRSLD